MFANQAPVMHIQVPGKGQVNPAFLSPIPMARGIPNHKGTTDMGLIELLLVRYEPGGGGETGNPA